MGKRSNFERNPRDFYRTPYEAVLPLLVHLPRRNGAQATTFIEPCAGDGQLIRNMAKHGFSCTYACDIEPQIEGIKQRDVLYFPEKFRLPQADMIITNPPWDRDVLHRMIDVFRHHAPTWLLFDAGWMFTGQAKPYLGFCNKIVNVGRISWMGNNVSGMDDCCWYHFGIEETETVFKP